VTNTLIRRNLFQKFGPLEKYTSLGPDGFLELVQRYWTTPGCFKFSDLNPINEMQRRGIDDDTCLRRYFYRDDALRLWNAIQSCVKGILSLFYLSSDDVNNDIELKVRMTVTLNSR
jgi:arachidonate 5-lipoxygenase